VCRQYRSIAKKVLPAAADVHTYAKSWEEKTLTIGVTNSVWAEADSNEKTADHDEINRLNEKPVISTIKIHICNEVNGLENWMILCLSCKF